MCYLNQLQQVLHHVMLLQNPLHIQHQMIQYQQIELNLNYVQLLSMQYEQDQHHYQKQYL